jgi:hypothetical protein
MVTRIITWVGLYLAAYLTASGLDLWTTQLGLQQPGVSEGNVFFATGTNKYSAATASAITVIVGLLMLACVGFAAANAGRVGPLWLQHPVRSFAQPYLCPWPNAGIDRSPLHMLSAAIAIVPLRLLAALNNVLLSEGYAGPIGAAVRSVAARTTLVAGLAVVIGTAYIALTLALSPLSAWLIFRVRPTGRVPPAAARRPGPPP